MIETGEILQTMAMIQEQNFDIRTITLGINLLDCSHPSPEACAQRVYDKICRVAKDLVRTGEAIERELGIPIVNKRISVTPVSLICQGDPRPIAKALDRAAKEMGVNFLGGYSALMHKGATLADERLLVSIPGGGGGLGGRGARQDGGAWVLCQRRQHPRGHQYERRTRNGRNYQKDGGTDGRHGRAGLRKAGRFLQRSGG